MHSDPNSGKEVKLTEQLAGKYRQRARQFDIQFPKMQAQFNHSQQTDYYIVSVKFIQEWKQFCSKKQLIRKLPNTINHDIYQNGQLKKGLAQKADFEFINEKIYSLFEPLTDKTLLNKRQAVVIGNEKRVPVIVPTFRYVLINQDVLKDVDLRKLPLDEFLMREVDVSEQSTLEHLIKLVEKKSKIQHLAQARIWIPAVQMTREKLHNQIKTQLKPQNVPSYHLKGLGSRKQDLTAKISSLQLQQTSYFIIQIRNQNQRFYIIKDNQARCQSCNHFGQLTFICGCNQAKYCSQKCMEKDKGYHSRNCKFVEEQELNKPVVMTLKPKNRHGLVGLNNLGNTCFMNSCLQCLSHTMPLTNYFLRQYFEQEVNKVNPIGTKGKLVKNYAKFVKGMWCDEDDSYSPYSVKNAVSDINPMFSGYAQHDSQEFFSFLVDGLHEDLNRIEKKPYVESVEQNGKSEIQLAKESWAAHLKRNQSIITDLMSGQYRSIVTCPDCSHTSTTFDPFITVSLPIPQNAQSSSQFFLIHSNMQKKNKRAWFKYLKKDAQQWNKKACEAVGSNPDRCFLYAVSIRQSIYRVGRQSIAQIANKIENQGKNMFLIEFSEEEMAVPKEHAIEYTWRLSKKWNYESEEIFFKLPMILDKRLATGLTFYKRVLMFLYSEAYDNSKNRKTFGWGSKSYEEYEVEMLKERNFKILLRLDKKIERSYHKIEVDFKKEIQIHDDSNIFELIENEGVKPADCQLDARFERGKYGEFSFDKLKDFDTVGKEPKLDRGQSDVDLEKCLESFSAPEKLQAGNQWYCSMCKQHKLAKKQLSIYRSPKILILHLKRFKQKGSYRKQKNQSLVKFPLELDMKPFLINQSPIHSYREEIPEQYKIPKPQQKAQQILSLEYGAKSEPIYELYAISNHFGGLGGGHYTAYAKNQGEWFNFDDSHVSSAGKKDIVSSSAYLLFYQRKEKSN